MSFAKESELMRAGAAFFVLLSDRLEKRDHIGAQTWYEDLAWGIRLLVDNGAVYFSGESAESWLWLADLCGERSKAYVGRGEFIVPVEKKGNDPATVRQAIENIKKLVDTVRGLQNAFSVEFNDTSGLLPSGHRGLTKGECAKLVGQFTDTFWGYKYDRIRDVNYKWLRAVHNDLADVQRQLGEPFHAGDLGGGNPNDPMPPVSFPEM